MVFTIEIDQTCEDASERTADESIECFRGFFEAMASGLAKLRFRVAELVKSFESDGDRDKSPDDFRNSKPNF